MSGPGGLHYRPHRRIRTLLGPSFGVACFLATLSGVIVLSVLLGSILGTVLGRQSTRPWYAVGDHVSQLGRFLWALATKKQSSDPTLASIPFFLFMGYLLERAGLMERLFPGFQLMFAGLRGSLYLAVLVTATIFTGIVGSSVTLLGVMAAPAMQRSGYDMRMSAGAKIGRASCRERVL